MMPLYVFFETLQIFSIFVDALGPLELPLWYSFNYKLLMEYFLHSILRPDIILLVQKVNIVFFYLSQNSIYDIVFRH